MISEIHRDEQDDIVNEDIQLIRSEHRLHIDVNDDVMNQWFEDIVSELDSDVVVCMLTLKLVEFQLMFNSKNNISSALST